MTLSLGIRLVIIFPTLLFLIGFSFKAIIQRESFNIIKKNVEKEIYDKLEGKIGLDFFYILAIDSVFLFTANGLILIFELQKIEIGIIAMIVGLILSMFVLTGIYAKSGFFSAFGISSVYIFLFLEFAYFCSYETPFCNGTFFIIFAGIGALVGVGTSLLTVPLEELKEIFGKSKKQR